MMTLVLMRADVHITEADSATDTTWTGGGDAAAEANGRGGPAWALGLLFASTLLMKESAAVFSDRLLKAHLIIVVVNL